MKSETKFLSGILIATLVLLFGGVFLLTRGRTSAQQSVAGTNVVQIDYSKGEKIGSDSAKVKLAEFSDFECPACLTAEPYVEKIRSNYPNQVELIYFQFPLPQHSHSRQAATIALAAAEQGKFWEMHDKLFETQTQWTTLFDKDANAFFLNLAKQLNLDEARLNTSLQDSAVKAKIDADIALGNQVGINATPTFFLNGRKLNLQSFNDLNTAVADELKK